MTRRARAWDHHRPCPGGCGELVDECACPPGWRDPLGGMTVEPPIGSVPRRWPPPQETK